MVEGVTHEIVEVTPEIAEEWLENNTINRPLSDQRVEAYANEMTAGRWPFAGESVQFDVDGNLLNGQHRLNAIIKSGVTLPMLVIRGLPRAAMDVMDSGRKRSAANTLTGHGEKYGVTLGAAIRTAIRQQEKLARRTIPNSEVLAWLDLHPNIRQAVLSAATYYKDTLLPSRAILAYALYEMREKDVFAAESFLIDLAKGANLPEDDPVLALSRRLGVARRERHKIPEDEQLSLLFQAWNARREGKPMTRIWGRKPGGVVEIPEVL